MTNHIDASSLAMFREALLAPDETASVRAHLAGCARCRAAESQLAAVSELLASAPVPPMPAGLSARIETALAAEAAARQADGSAAAAGAPLAGEPSAAAGGPAGSAGADPGPDQPAGAGTTADAPAASGAGARSATGLQPRSGPLRPGQTVPVGAGSGPGRGTGASRPAGGRPLARGRARLRVLAAAAAVAVIGGGGYAAVQLTAQGGSPAAHVPAARSGLRTAGPVVQGPNRPPAAQVTISTVTSGTDYRPARFASQVHAILARYPAGVIRPTGGAERALPGGSLAGCVHAVTGGQPARLVDVARYEGRPAMVIVVAPSLTGPARAWAVGRDCSATRPDVLARVSVPAGS